jgi:high affinity Mn2+ porin
MKTIRKHLLLSFTILLSIVGLPSPSFAQRDHNNNFLDSLSDWSLHLQFTTITQFHTRFRGAGYDGPNTLSARGDTALSVTTTLFLGRRLWRGAAVYLNPEIAGGLGVGHRDSQHPYDQSGYTPAVGVAGFPNGETFRIGSPRPAVYTARIYIEQVFALPDNRENEEEESEPNQVKQSLPKSRVVVTAGKFSIADIFDNNQYAHDPRVHFMNWSLMSHGAWDYPANTRGYTWSLALEYVKPMYAVRFAGSLMPKAANGNVLDWNIAQSNSLNLEYEQKFRLFPQQGTFRVLAYRNRTKAPAYREATELLQAGTYPQNPAYILTGKSYGGIKYGFGLNLEQPITKNSGFFGRASWNDGKTATWAFTEIDRSYSVGGHLNGSSWKRPNDAIGLAVVRNDISPDHRAFLNAGGRGFMLGDGRLPNYGGEKILELFYSARLARMLWITADYQLVGNPGYNADRGPVNFFAIRTHVEF